MKGSLNKYFSHLETIVRNLPQKPGVYQYFDDKNRIIYVGKAKNLKKKSEFLFQQDQLYKR